MPSSFNDRSGTVEGASHIRSVALRGLRERNHFADGSFARQDHHQAVQAQRDSAVRRRAVFQRFQQEAEAPLGFFLGEPERGENLRLHVAAMNTNRARAQFHAVQHQVVRLGAAARRIGGQLLEILVMHRSERMMRRVPAILFVVPFEHREIHHPEELEILGVEQLVAVVVLLRGVQTQLPAGLIDGLFGTLALAARRAQPASISRSSSPAPAALAHLRHLLRIVAVQALQIVENAQAALLAEGFQLVALLAAQRARPSECGSPPSGRPFAASSGSRSVHRIQRRNAQIRLVAAVGAHGLRVSEARERRLHLVAGHFAHPLHQRLDHLRRCAPAAGTTSPDRSA